MNFSKQNIYSEKILRTYEENIFYLPLVQMGHFFLRAYKITGDKKYEQFIAYHALLRKIPRIRLFLEMFRKEEYAPILEGFRDYPREKLRQKPYQLYKEVPKIKFLNSLLNDMWFLHMIGLDKTVLKNEYIDLVRLLRRCDLRQTFLNQEVLESGSVFALNSSIILSKLGISDFARSMIHGIRTYYLGAGNTLKQNLPAYDYQAFLYILTHVFIVEFGFYEDFVTGHSWILQYLFTNLEEILKRASNDVLAEVAFVFILARKEKEYQTALKLILQELVVRRKVLFELENPETLIEKEHINSILMMLFKNPLVFFRGPDLSKHKLFLRNYYEHT